MKKWERKIINTTVSILGALLMENLPHITAGITAKISGRKRKPQPKTIDLDESQYKIID